MNFKLLLKVTGVALFSSLALANDCQDIEDYLEKNGHSFTGNINKCDVDKNGNVTSIDIYSDTLTLKEIEKIASYNTIKSIHYYYGYISDDSEDHFHMSKLTTFPTAFAKLPNLEDLNLTYSGIREYDRAPIDKGVLSVSKTLKKLTVDGVQLSDDNVKEISELTNLEELHIVKTFEKKNFDSFKNLTKLTTLEIARFHHYPFEEVPEFIFSLTNLKKLILTGQEIPVIPSDLSKLTKLEYLDLQYNGITSELPESLNTLSNLEYINLLENYNLTGKTLTNKNLKECYYELDADLCKSKDMSCFVEQEHFEVCEGGSSTEVKISEDGKCGKENGRCPEGRCCSKYGWCGTTDKYCSLDEGCQSEFGECDGVKTTKKTTTKKAISIKVITKKKVVTKKVTISKKASTKKASTTTTKKDANTKGRCGEGIGNCPAGECCSKHGWCGRSQEHCDVDQGCQSKFGKCVNVPLSTDSKCGLGVGKCPKGQCCSKYGWCGRSEQHCSAKMGCQSEFGECTTYAISTDGKCGSNFRRCPDGECCSKYGFCGTRKDYCDAGCQRDFGRCD